MMDPTTDNAAHTGDPATARASLEALRAEIRRLQDSLGGPQVDRFPSLQAQGFGVPVASGRSRDGRSSAPREAIRALRDAAAQLDVTANRLEQLELFGQADDLTLAGAGRELALGAA